MNNQYIITTEAIGSPLSAIRNALNNEGVMLTCSYTIEPWNPSLFVSVERFGEVVAERDAESARLTEEVDRYADLVKRTNAATPLIANGTEGEEGYFRVNLGVTLTVTEAESLADWLAEEGFATDSHEIREFLPKTLVERVRMDRSIAGTLDRGELLQLIDELLPPSREGTPT